MVCIVEREFPDFRHEGGFMGVPATGNRLMMEAIHIYRFEGDRVVERRVA